MPAAPSSKYLYERLGDKRFQNLCAAIVTAQMDDVEVFPVGQSDGGRDITADRRNTVLQVKFTANPTSIKNPTGWLDAAIAGEAKKIKKLVTRGCKHYILMTNIEGSAVPTRGDRDKFEKALDVHRKAFKIGMSVMWRGEVDSWVDLSGQDLKLAYVDMLAGSDALIALLQSTQLQANEQDEKNLLLDYVGTAWAREKVVKFTQGDLKSNLLTDLFVDVTADQTALPRGKKPPKAVPVGGLATYLLSGHAHPLVLLEGIPGQGKSTAAQYLSQAYRADFIGKDKLKTSNEAYPPHNPDAKRLPIRLDLADYALWIAGHDPFDTTGQPPKKEPSPRKRADLETFLLKHLQNHTVGYALDLARVRSLLDRFATFIVLDGLDEVAQPDIRERVVQEVNEFIHRRYAVRPGNLALLITTRPNASGLAEPDAALFERLTLNPLTERLRLRYMRQWATAHSIVAADRRNFERLFSERTAAPHVAQLANNPMQLALLLNLMRKKGDSLPNDRTALYRAYMDLFLDREVEKSTAISSIVKDHRDDIEESTAYIGWHMQGLAELNASAARLPRHPLVREMKQYLAGLGRTAPVEAIFEALNDRVWVLTSKHSGTYEFDVQPIREYVAARYLHEFVAAEDSDFEPLDALTEMLPRAYWMNTARFLAGHITPGYLNDAAEEIEEALLRHPGARQTRTTTWALLSDGVFRKRPKVQARLAIALANDLTVALIAHGPDRTENLSLDYGGKAFAEQLLTDLENNPDGIHSGARARLIHQIETIDTITQWWLPRITAAIGTEHEAAWLKVGTHLGATTALTTDIAHNLHLATPRAAHWALASGAPIAADSDNHNLLLNWVLDGHGLEANPHGNTEAADLLRVYNPRTFRSLARGVPIGSTTPRTKAIARFRERNPAFENARKAMTGGKNTHGNTSRWVDPAVQLADIYDGPRWFFTVIAATALTLPPHDVPTGGATDKNRPAFGPDMHYGNWVQQVRLNAAKANWWTEQHKLATNEHSKAAWILALLLAAPEDLIRTHCDTLNATVASLSPNATAALLAASYRLTECRTLPTITADGLNPATRILLAHIAQYPAEVIGTDPATLLTLTDLPGNAPAAELATQLAAHTSNINALNLVTRFGHTGRASLDSPTLTPDAATHILNNASNFPAQWVQYAENNIAKANEPAALRVVAETQWHIR